MNSEEATAQREKQAESFGSFRLRDRFGCNVIALDITHSGPAEAAKKGFAAVTGDVQALPLRSDQFDLIWCRDMLECVWNPGATLQEFNRILKPGGGVALYVAFTTPELEPRERARLSKALDMPSWWDEGSRPVDEAIRAAGFDVVTREPISPEYTERALMDRDNETIDDFATLGRLRRERARFEAEMGTVWYERWVGWMQWSLYLLLGKIQTIAWTLRKRV